MTSTEEMHEFTCDLARQTVLQDGYHVPIHMLLGGTESVILADDVCNVESKDMLTIKLHKLSKQMKSTVYQLVCMANVWTLKATTDKNKITTTEIKEKGNYIDALIIKTESSKKEVIVTIYEVVKDSNKKIVDLILHERDYQTNADNMEGRFTNIV